MANTTVSGSPSRLGPCGFSALSWPTRATCRGRWRRIWPGSWVFADPGVLKQYAVREGTNRLHAGEIQHVYGYRDFADPAVHAELVGWLEARTRLASERLGVLFDLATARLLESKVLLPGPTVLARLIASVRDQAATRLWGPNWNQIPINRAHVPINDMLRDGQHQDAVHGGAAPYRPNSLDGGCPFVAGPADHPFIDVPVPVAAAFKVRENPVTFDDHFSQVSMFYRSLAPVEQDHVIAAYTFELSKCYKQVIRERQLLALVNIDKELCLRVATGLGLDAPAPTVAPVETESTTAISQLGGNWPVAGRVVGVVIGPDSDAADIASVRGALIDAGILPLVVGPHGGKVGTVTVQRTYANAASIEFDAVVVVGNAPPAADAVPSLDAKSATEGGPDTATDPRVSKMISELWRHAKAIGAVPGAGSSIALLHQEWLSARRFR